MATKASDSEAAFEQAIQQYVSGLNRAVREFVAARYEASLFQGAADTQKAQQAAKEAWAREEAHLKAVLEKALRRYLQESSQRSILEQSQKQAKGRKPS